MPAQVYGSLHDEALPMTAFRQDTPLLRGGGGRPAHNGLRRFQRPVALLAAIAVAAVAMTHSLSGPASASSSLSESGTPPAAVMSVRPGHTATAEAKNENETSHIYLWNEYTTFDDNGKPSRIPGVNLYTAFKAEQVLEPHRDTTLQLTHSYDEASVSISWAVAQSESIGTKRPMSADLDRETLWGAQVVRAFVRAGFKYTILATVHDATDTDKVLETVSMTANCLYVRREIRSLTEADRKDLLSAMWVPYALAEDEGKQTYGKNYMALESIHQMHNYWASDRSCDHLHDGYGFGTQHLALTVRYEGVLQAINPKVVVPYWEYTMDAAEVETNYDGNYNKFYSVSPVFSEDWFGGFNAMKAPWSSINVTATTVDTSKPSRTNPFGQMRSPWNFAHQDNVVRYDQRCGFNTADLLMGMEEPSSCSAFASVLAYDTFTDFTWRLMQSPHGSIHILLGGISGECDTTYKEALTGFFSDADVAKIAALSAVSLKDLWRVGYVNFTSCTMDAPEECQQIASKDYARSGAEIYNNILPAWGVHALNESNESNPEYLTALGRVISETPLSIGDMYSSSATIDPLFWIMHTTTDRLQTFKRGKKDNFTDIEWPENNDCYGHSPDDVTIFDMRSSVGFSEDTELTNQDVLDVTNPASADYQMPYIYDNFNYEHCNFDRYPIFRVDYTPSSVNAPTAKVDLTTEARFGVSMLG